ncbi:MAG: molybdopterin molybdotransferase MoeA [Chryseolinea sp.]
MVTAAQASAIVLNSTFQPDTNIVRVEDAVNSVLAENIIADRDLPPFDRVTMDGIAIGCASWTDGNKLFFIEATQAAGIPQKQLANTMCCIEVMTGTGLPIGTDTVIPYEDVDITEGAARVTVATITKGQNIHRRGSDAKAGELLLTPGVLLSPAEIALIASVGKSTISVFSFPPTAIISSGDELVPIETIPAAHQVRRSNSYAIQAAMKTLGWEGTIFHLPDDREEMTSVMRKITSAFKVIILSGGVSKGKFDFIPLVLDDVGIAKSFHRVNQRPGKPFWFGTSKNGHTVFALPGNPVSTYMCFYRYIKPWMLKSMGVEVAASAILAEDFSPPKGITYFLQVDVRNEDGKLMAYPIVGGGSGDFANLKRVSGFLEIPEGIAPLSKGTSLAYYSFRIDI